MRTIMAIRAVAVLVGGVCAYFAGDFVDGDVMREALVFLGGMLGGSQIFRRAGDDPGIAK